MNNINNELPCKGKDILGVDHNGDEHYCFRCDCNNSNCLAWRCSLTGFELIISICYWKYIT